MFKTIISQCGVIYVCSSSSTCGIILWMVKGVFVTKDNLHTSFLYVNFFYKLRALEGDIPPQHNIPYVKWDINL